MRNNVKINFIYNISYQLLMIVIPLITVPIITRRLGANNLGVYSFSYSITNYFMLFGMLGISNYGNREIAKNRKNKDVLSKTFWDIYLIQFLFSFLALSVYFIYVFLFSKYKLVSLIQSLFVLSSLLDINWFFFGIEKFKITVTRNAIIKIISLFLIVFFVRDVFDLWKYTLIVSGGTLLSQLILWFFIREEINFLSVKDISFRKHLKGVFKLFIPVISYSIYKIMDKTMIGIITTVSDVAFYENAEKIINIPTLIVAALGTVMMPRVSNLISEGNKNKAKDFFDKSIEFVLFFVLPVIFGIFVIGKELCNIYLGSGFEKSGELLQILSITILFISIANVIRTQYLIPLSKDNIYIISTIIGAIINFILNIIFINFFGVSGACIGTVAAEMSVMLYQIYNTRNDINYKKYFKLFFSFLFKSLTMALFVFLIKQIDFFESNIFNIFLSIVVGILTYLLLNYNYIGKFVDLKKLQISKN